MYPIFNKLPNVTPNVSQFNTHTEPLFYGRSKPACVTQLYVYVDFVHLTCLQQTEALQVANPTSKRTYQISVNTAYHNLSQFKPTLLTWQVRWHIPWMVEVLWQCEDVTYNSYRKAQTFSVQFLQGSTSPLRTIPTGQHKSLYVQFLQDSTSPLTYNSYRTAHVPLRTIPTGQHKSLYVQFLQDSTSPSTYNSHRTAQVPFAAPASFKNVAVLMTPNISSMELTLLKELLAPNTLLPEVWVEESSWRLACNTETSIKLQDKYQRF
jgi:hypothetical protein